MPNGPQGQKRPTDVKSELDPDHADWLVKNRGDNQIISAKLYRLLKTYPKQIDQFAPQVQALVAVAFSLWRSAFLSDKTGLRSLTTKNAIGFLSEMVQNNAIAFSSERSAKDWTFNYYATNARYRLEDLVAWWPDMEEFHLLPRKGQQTPKNRWEHLHEAFCIAVNHFEDLLIRARKNSN